MAPQPSSLRTSFRALCITRIEIKESVIYTAESDRYQLTENSQDLFVAEFSSILATLLGFLPSLDHFIRSIQHRLRNGQADLLRRFEIDDELELYWLFHRQISRLGTFQNLVHVRSGTPMEVSVICSIEHETAFIDKLFWK
jgi:hypothetical protein